MTKVPGIKQQRKDRISDIMLTLENQGLINSIKTSDSPKDEKLKVRSEVTVGSSPAEEIIKFANDKQLDIIIIGSQRLETISKIKALGSVARRVYMKQQNALF